MVFYDIFFRVLFVYTKKYSVINIEKVSFQDSEQKWVPGPIRKLGIVQNVLDKRYHTICPGLINVEIEAERN